ncbi:hypothetical protein D7M10_02735 [Pseudomonas fluorescens]|nr:hypothetical protein D7M10_02735 [Pseudomonas fluorescens]
MQLVDLQHVQTLLKSLVGTGSTVGAGLPAMASPRSIRHTELSGSQRCGDPTRQLPHLIWFPQ